MCKTMAEYETLFSKNETIRQPENERSSNMPLKMFSGCLWLFNYRIGNLQTVCVAKPHTRHTVLNKTWLVLPADAPSVMVWAKEAA